MRSPDEAPLLDTRLHERHHRRPAEVLRLPPGEVAPPRPQPESDALRYVGSRGRAWRKAKQEYLQGVARLCECDDPDCTEPAVHVHHIDGLGPTGPRGLDPTNFQALSAECHATPRSSRATRAGSG